MVNIEIPVDLPGVKVIDVKRNNQGQLFITVQTTEKSVPCRQCGKQLTQKHGCDKERTLKHLPVFGNPTYIIYKPHRYICQNCDNRPTTTAIAIWHKQNSNFTIEYEKHAMMELVNSTIADVCFKERITEAQVLGIMDRHIESTVNWDTIKYLGVIGIDEISLKKGYKDYVTLITARHEGKIRLLAVIDGREKAKIKRFLKSIPARLKRTVEGVCVDMYDGYVNAAKEVFKKRTILVIDRFHVAKLYRKELDKYRQKILKELKDMLPKDEYEKLKGAMQILRKGNESASKKDKEVVEELFSHSPELAEAYNLGLKLTQIFNTHMNKDQALQKLNEWIKEVKRSQVPCFKTFIKTLKKYKNEIANYFIDRNTSAFVEGLNNKAKVLKRRCYGIFNVKRLFQRLHLDISGYRLLPGLSAC